jgi:hypothetical protein
LRADQLAAQASRALDEASVPNMLLRGPVIGRWLYDEPAERPYLDADILIPADARTRANEILAGLGLTAPLGGAAPTEQTDHAEAHMTRDGASVDLHWTLSGIGSAPGKVWEVLGRGSEEMLVAGAEVGVPRAAARALIVALHAAQHGPQGPVQLEDIHRATTRLPQSVWNDAATLAGELEAVPAFVAGLSQAQGGGRVLRKLGLSAGMTADLAVRAEGDVPLIRGLSRLSETGWPAEGPSGYSLLT